MVMILNWPMLLKQDPAAYKPFKKMSDQEKMLRHGWRLGIIEVTYKLPESKILPPPYVWQYLDDPEKLLRTGHFARYWKRNIRGEVIEARLDFVGPGQRPKVRNAVEFPVRTR